MMDYLKEISAFNRATATTKPTFLDKLIILVGTSVHYDNVPILDASGKHTGRYSSVSSSMTELEYWTKMVSTDISNDIITDISKHGVDVIMMSIDELTSASVQPNVVFAMCWFMTILRAYLAVDFISDFVSELFSVHYNHEIKCSKMWLYE